MGDANNMTVSVVDLFAGVGGSSCGARAAGAQVVAAVDAWPLACEVYADNHHFTSVYNSPCEELEPLEIRKRFGRIDLLLASPECTNHTCAKGAAERSESSRATAFQVVRFADALRPMWIVIENVLHMQSWSRYHEFLTALESMGYHCKPQVLNAVDFGVPQSRRRLFILCKRGQDPPEIVPPTSVKPAPARTIIDTNGTYGYSPLKTVGRASATLERAERAIAKVGDRMPFLIVYYGSDGSGGWQRLSSPLRTITTLDRFAYVRRRNGVHEMRMLQVPELKNAMGFQEEYVIERGTRRDRIKLLGNAVCPPVMEYVVRTLISRSPSNSRTNPAGRQD